MNILAKNNKVIADVINRVLNCRKLKILDVYGKAGSELDSLYPAIRIRTVEKLAELSKNVGYLRIENTCELEKMMLWITETREREDLIIYVSNGVEISETYKNILGISHHIGYYSDLEGTLFLSGTSFQIPKKLIVSNEFKVLAMIHFYNEVDIIEKTILYLLSQELDLYLLDNWSDDGSYEIARRYQQLYPDRIYLERFPISGKTANFELYEQLERTEVLSRDLNYNWFLHYDMDEMRVSPWKDVSLRKAIYWIDKSGYNCIENTVIDFWYTEQDVENIFMKDTFFDFRHERRWFFQLKTWKKTDQIDLKSSGGHWAKIANPKIYPLKILNRHYPLRSLEQAEKKVFRDRLPRFKKEKKERGWHSHYDHLKKEENVIRKSTELLYWGADICQKLYIPLFMECGVRWDTEVGLSNIELPYLENKKLVIYGAGNIGKRVYQMEIGRNHIVGWADKSYEVIPNMLCETLVSIADVANMKFDYIIIAVRATEIQREVRTQMKEFGILDEKIICV
jgi:hypothetical protein